MTTQNFPRCPNPHNSIFAWALRSDVEDVVEAIEYCKKTESGIQLQALLALAED